MTVPFFCRQLTAIVWLVVLSTILSACSDPATPIPGAITASEPAIASPRSYSPRINSKRSYLGAAGSMQPALTTRTFIAGWGSPSGVALDQAGNLYVADFDDGVVKELSPTGTVVNTWKNFAYPTGVAVGASGAVYVTTLGAGGEYSTTGTLYEIRGGTRTALATNLPSPMNVAVDALGNVFFVNEGVASGGTCWGSVEKVSASGAITNLGFYTCPTGIFVEASGNVLVATEGRPFYGTGKGVYEIAPDGTSSQISSTGCLDVAKDPWGNLYLTYPDNQPKVRKILADGTWAAVGVDFSKPGGMALDSSGAVLYVADWSYGAVRKIDPTGMVPVGLGSPTALAVDSAGNLYVADAGNRAVYKVLPYGYGYGYGYAFGLSAIASGYTGPNAVAVDKYNAVYFLSGNQALKVTSAGTVTTLASGFSSPTAIAVSASARYVYVSDSGHDAVKRIDQQTGAITDIGGSLVTPQSVAVDTSGNVYVAAASAYHCTNIYKVAPNGTVSAFGSVPGCVSTLTFGAGNLYANGGTSTSIYKVLITNGATTKVATPSYLPTSLAVDSSGNIYALLYYTGVVKKITP